MAQPDIIRGTYFVLAMGNGATPTETFTALCGITTRTFTYTANTNDQFTRDCADPENVPVRNAIVTGEQWELAGEGVLNRSQLQDLIDAQGQPKHYRFYYTEPADDEVFRGYWSGTFILNNFVVNGNDDAFATVSVNFVSDGVVTWTPTAGS
jgi:hypothetical protein